MGKVTESPLFNLPQELKDRESWMVCGHAKEKWPLYPHPPFYKGSSNNPKHWCDYTTALDSLDFNEKIGGIGLVLTEQDPLVCIDLDGCLDSEGRPTKEASGIVKMFDSYTEISRSGRGLHIFVSCSGFSRSVTRKGFEIYSHGRFMITTGVLFGENRELKTVFPEDLQRLILRYSPNPAEKPQLSILHPDLPPETGTHPLLDMADFHTIGGLDIDLLRWHLGAAPSDKLIEDYPGEASEIDRSEATFKMFLDLARLGWTVEQVWSCMLSFTRVQDYLSSKWGHLDYSGQLGKFWKYTGSRALSSPELEKPTIEQEAKAGGLPVIVTNNRPTESITTDAWEALLAQEADVFTSAGRLCGVETMLGRHQITGVTGHQLASKLERSARWVREYKKGNQGYVPVPSNVYQGMVADPLSTLPQVDKIITSPVFGRKGDLIKDAGADRVNKVYFIPHKKAEMYKVPENPTAMEVEAAYHLIEEDLLVDFNFVTPADRAHAWAALLLPVIRNLVAGPTPIHLIESPLVGSGKTLLGRLVSIVATGRDAALTTVPKNSDELRKKLTAALVSGSPLILLDNIKNSLDSTDLAAAVTSSTWEDRVLGQTKMVQVDNNAVWIATGNNPKLSLEIARRCIRIRIDARTATPWEGRTFKHPDIISWALENQAALASALLTIVQDWLTSDCVGFSGGPLGSFEKWSHVVGGILQRIGVEGFLTGLEDFYLAADTGVADWATFVSIWLEEKGEDPVSVSDLWELAAENGLGDFAVEGNKTRSEVTALGIKLRKNRDCIIDGYAITWVPNKSASKKAPNKYRLLEVTE